MATHIIGTGGDYTTLAAAEAALTLPEAGGTVYEITGTLTAVPTFTGANYDNGLTLTAKTGEECDGKGNGAFIDADVATTLYSRAFTISDLRVRSLDVSNIRQAGSTADKCVFGENCTTDVLVHNSQTKLDFTDCIIQDGSDDGTYQSQIANSETFVQCTFVDAARYNAMRVHCTDCLSIGAGTGDFFDLATGSDYNASEDATATNTNSITGRSTTDLEDYAGGNYNLASGSSLNTSGSGGGRIGAFISATASAPVLSLPTEASITSTTVTVGATTDDDTGTLYYYISTSASAPSAANLKSGSGAVKYGSDASLSVGANTFAVTGLTSAVTYYTYFVQNDGASDSNILESGSWVTEGVVANIQFDPETTHDVIQAMTTGDDAANTTDGESIFASTILTVEDNHIAHVPKSVNGMNITWAANGTFTTDADQTENITASYWAPSTGNWSCITLTIDDTAVNVATTVTTSPATRSRLNLYRQ